MGKRVFKKKTLPRRKRKDTEAVLLIKGWQKQVISYYHSIEGSIKRLATSVYRLVKLRARS